MADLSFRDPRGTGARLSELRRQLDRLIDPSP
jgi:hypothetical protein